MNSLTLRLLLEHGGMIEKEIQLFFFQRYLTIKKPLIYRVRREVKKHDFGKTFIFKFLENLENRFCYRLKRDTCIDLNVSRFT